MFEACGSSETTYYLYYLGEEDAGSGETWAGFRVGQRAGVFWLQTDLHGHERGGRRVHPSPCVF